MPELENGTMISQESLDSFKMPPISQGQTVRWFPSGIPGTGKRDTEAAVVLRVAHRGVTLKTIEGQQVKTSVRHVDDPKLRLNAEQRQEGAWDYPQKYYDELEWKDGIESRLEIVEDKVARVGVKVETVTGENSDKKPSGFEQIAKLKSKLTKRGINFDPKATLKELQELDAVATENET